MKSNLIRTFFFLLLVNPLILFGQEVSNDSYTIQRLLVFNSDGEILLEKHVNGWMTPALRHNSKTSTNDGLKNLASEFGLRISTPKLSGIFMFISEYKLQSSFRQHYVSNYIGGELKLPEGKLDAKWFEPQKAIEMMSLPDAKLIGAVREMTEQLLNYPEIIWGGTFNLWKEDGVTIYRVSENFYSIAKKD